MIPHCLKYPWEGSYFHNVEGTDEAFKDKLRNIKMQKNDIISQYLTRFTQVRDEIGGVGVNVG